MGYSTRNIAGEIAPTDIEVAALGQPYIATYLYAAHSFSIEEIADNLNIKQSSVSQYLSDVANQHR